MKTLFPAMTRNSLPRLLLALCVAFGLALGADAIERKGNVVASQPDRATIEFSDTNGIQEGDTVRFVTEVAGRTLDAGRGSVVSISGGSVEASVDTGRVNLGMSALVTLKAVLNECDALASIPGDLFAVSDGVSLEELDALTAIKACRAATKEFPEEARFQAQLAYSYLAAEQPARAVLTFERALALRSDYPSALHSLASIYRFGPEELQNHKEARKRFAAAADLGHLPTYPIYATMCREGLGGEVDYDAAAKWFELAAEEDDPYSQNAFGECYENGWGVERNPSMALLWYRSAAEQGFSSAMRNIGRAFKNGMGVSENPDTAVDWFKRAAEAGDPEAQYELALVYIAGVLVKPNMSEGIKWLEMSAESDFAKSIAKLGLMHLEGEGFKRDYDVAAHYFGRGAELGHTASQYNYAVLLERGSGVERDRDLAIDFYRKAARKEHKPSQERLTRLKLDW